MNTKAFSLPRTALSVALALSVPVVFASATAQAIKSRTGSPMPPVSVGQLTHGVGATKTWIECINHLPEVFDGMSRVVVAWLFFAALRVAPGGMSLGRLEDV